MRLRSITKLQKFFRGIFSKVFKQPNDYAMIAIKYIFLIH